MSAYIEKRLEALGKTDEDVIKWAKEHGHGSLLPTNLSFVKQIYLDENDTQELQFPDLEMRGRRVSVKDIPTDNEWVIIRVYMLKIARTAKYPMCTEDGCYGRVKGERCNKCGEYVTEALPGIRHYYLAGDGGDGDTEGARTYVIVPAQYAMNGWNFEHMWCDIKGNWNEPLGGFWGQLILPVNGDNPKKEIPKIAEVEEEEEESLPTGYDYSAFSKQTETEKKPKSTTDAVRKAEIQNFGQIIQFMDGYKLSQFDDFIQSNDIKTPLKELIESTPGCRIEGEGDKAIVRYKKP